MKAGPETPEPAVDEPALPARAPLAADADAATLPPPAATHAGHPTDGDGEALSRVELVYRQLREALVNGEYAPGAPLRPDRLSRVYDVSLIPIREALRKLEVERLVEATPNKGVRVAPISVDDLVDVYATREMLEVEALRRAWPRLDSGAVRALRELREDMLLADREGRAADAYDLHRRVHFAIYELSGSPWLLHLIDILWHHTERYRRLVARVATFLDEGRDLHGRVLDAIALGDPDMAGEALRLDLGRTRDLILAANPAQLGSDPRGVGAARPRGAPAEPEGAAHSLAASSG